MEASTKMYRDSNQEDACSVVWTKLPLLSWICPAIGHVGVTDSHGIVYDFEGPYYIGKGNMLFGRPLYRWKIDIDPQQWDGALETVTERFSDINYNLFTSNCHYYAAAVLQEAGVIQIPPFFGSWINGATIQIIWGLILHSKPKSFSAFIKKWLPFIIILIFIIYFFVL
ncbi:hypothetical protein TVAG_199110 [Trichomonas vaginalis G3]|uniref:PPPDE domain-containing protein n=1 Tax=Trichomonas vaginalis (strain ATCC PRA-98 / G3) TaxID=412133 RepID=A2DDU6_TRIV3|nr:protein of unknown function, DUF778 [Trichomonas vaginalis G3]EAY21472.1 hypothetical protein TVAG_199110 [Trichomonas vaginalis G3]KAI5490685.1 protein of unknown function, DUF778 [Trichomonas vaginalis G3]|eukprot:XP_001582458.1 hypothetical protein [Trichomonas vaginalis G3]